MLNAAKEFEAEDRAILEAIETRNRLEAQALDLKNKLDDELSSLDEDDKDTIREACTEVLEFIDDNPANPDTLEDYKEKLIEFDELVKPLLSNAQEAGYGHDDDEDWEHDEL